MSAPAGHPRPASPLTLATRGTWVHMMVAGLLITGIPLLVLGWLAVQMAQGRLLPVPVLCAVAAGTTMLILTGYLILVKYPASIVRLRRYLHILASGQIPKHVKLPHEEDDLAAIQHYMEFIIKIAEERIAMLNTQHESALAAERQRVMIDSIGSTCHHVSQPLTTIGICLHHLATLPLDHQALAPLKECQRAYDEVSLTISRLQRFSQLRADLLDARPLVPAPGTDLVTAQPNAATVIS